MKKNHAKCILTSFIASVLLVQAVSFPSFAADSNPDLEALAEEYGYDQDTFQFTNHLLDSDLISDDEISELEKYVTKTIMSSEERIHNMDAAYSMAAGGFCYGMTALSVLVHNGVISPSDLQSGAETLHDVTLDHDVERQLYLYAVSQAYQDVSLANHRNYNVYTKEERVDELLSMAEKCQESNSYYMISYYGISSSGLKFAHAVTGIGMAKGNWMFSDLRNYVTYDTCILTYDSNASEYVGDVNISGGFSPNLCIYINSDTKQFCIPSYGITSENSGQINFVTDATSRFTYRSEINGTDTVGEDVSDVTELYFFWGGVGTKSYAVSEDGEKLDITDWLSNNDGLEWNSTLYYPSNHFIIEQNNAGDYQTNPSVVDYEDTGTDGSLFGHKYCTRYGIGNGNDAYNYTIDATSTSVTITNNGLVAKNDSGIPAEMYYTAGLTQEGKYYYYFWGTAGDGETMTMQQDGDGVILSASDGTLKGHMMAIYDDQEKRSAWAKKAKEIPSFDISIKDSCYVKFNDTTEKVEVYLDLDQDGVYESPLETGDTDGDGIIDVQDAVTVLTYYAKKAAKTTYGKVQCMDCYPYSIDTLDMNGDGVVDVQDAVQILTTYAKRAAGQENGTTS